MARLVAKHLTEALGQPVMVENRPGAGGNMAALAVAKAAPDGYTLLLTGTNHATNPTLIPDAGFDYERDLAPVTMVAEANMVLVAHPSLPAEQCRRAGRARQAEAECGHDRDFADRHAQSSRRGAAGAEGPAST